MLGTPNRYPGSVKYNDMFNEWADSKQEIDEAAGREWDFGFEAWKAHLVQKFGGSRFVGLEFNAFSMSDRPVSVKFGPGTSGNAKMKAVFTDGSGDTKTTQFGYKGMSDFTKHHDEGRKSSYLARHGAKSSGQKWNDPTTAGSLSRWVLWNKKSLSESKKSFKNKFNLRAEETNARYSVADLGYQESMFITDPGRRAVWDYETDYSVEDAE